MTFTEAEASFLLSSEVSNINILYFQPGPQELIGVVLITAYQFLHAAMERCGLNTMPGRPWLSATQVPS